MVVRPLSLVSYSSPSRISPVLRVTLVGSSGGLGEKYSCWKSPPPKTSNVVFSFLIDVIASAAAERISQIEMLELIVLVVGETEDEEFIAEVQIAAHATLNRVGGRSVRRRSVVACIHCGRIDRNFVAIGLANRFAGKREAQRRRVAARDAESGVEYAAPEIGEPRMRQAIRRVVVGLLLGVVADGHDRIFGRRNITGRLGRDINFVVRLCSQDQRSSGHLSVEGAEGRTRRSTRPNPTARECRPRNPF